MRVLDRFMGKVVRDPDTDCWEWLGVRGDKGYGRFSINRRPVFAHRASVILLQREDPSGFDVHHQCENPGCVNPAHLRVLTQRQHRLSHTGRYCHRGHELAVVGQVKSNRGALTCRACKRERSRAYYQRLRVLEGRVSKSEAAALRPREAGRFARAT